MNESTFQRIHQIVRLIPPGRVSSYGQIARLAGMPRGARTVGWALRTTSQGIEIPWHRVVSAQGTISLGTRGGDLQRALLEAEGIEFNENGRIDLKRYGWSGLDLGSQTQLREP